MCNSVYIYIYICTYVYYNSPCTHYLHSKRADTCHLSCQGYLIVGVCDRQCSGHECIRRARSSSSFSEFLRKVVRDVTCRPYQSGVRVVCDLFNLIA